jgi:hypothetical protein
MHRDADKLEGMASIVTGRAAREAVDARDCHDVARAEGGAHFE